MADKNEKNMENIKDDGTNKNVTTNTTTNNSTTTNTNNAVKPEKKSRENAFIETVNIAIERRKIKERERMYDAKRKEKEDYAKWLNDSIEFAWDHGYKLTEQFLADIVGVSQKSINRYRNAETLPNDSVRQKLESYFNGIKETVWEEQEEEMRWAALENSDYDDEPDDYDPYADYTTEQLAKEIAGFNSDRFSEYTIDTQKYILNNFELFWVVEKKEIEFIEKYRALDEHGKKKILHMLESIPISFKLACADGRSESNSLGFGRNVRPELYGEDSHRYFFAYADGRSESNSLGFGRNVRPEIYGEGSHRYFLETCDKNDMYHRFLQSKVKPPKFIFNDLDSDTGDICKIVNAELNTKFDELCIEFGQDLNGRYSAGDLHPEIELSNYYERLFRFHHENFYDSLNTMLKFTNEEWYLLFLLTRMQIVDFEDPNVTGTFEVAPDYEVHERESLLWMYLDMLSM